MKYSVLKKKVLSSSAFTDQISLKCTYIFDFNWLIYFQFKFVKLINHLLCMMHNNLSRYNNGNWKSYMKTGSGSLKGTMRKLLVIIFLRKNGEVFEGASVAFYLWPDMQRQLPAEHLILY